MSVSKLNSSSHFDQNQTNSVDLPLLDSTSKLIKPYSQTNATRSINKNAIGLYKIRSSVDLFMKHDINKYKHESNKNSIEGQKKMNSLVMNDSVTGSKTLKRVSSEDKINQLKHKQIRVLESLGINYVPMNQNPFKSIVEVETRLSD